MDNNDILVRLRYALDIKDNDMVDIFKAGGVNLSKESIAKMLINTKNLLSDELEDKEIFVPCTNSDLESFLNGFIIFKRGKQEPKDGEPEKTVLSIQNDKSINNIMLKKLKIALSLTSEDMLNIFSAAEIDVSKGELSALFRKEGHKHFKECGDKFARNFLKGLAITYRK